MRTTLLTGKSLTKPSRTKNETKRAPGGRPHLLGRKQPDAPPTSVAAQEAWRRQRRQEAIEAALDRLSPRQRSLFALKYRQGLTLQQAAGVMAVSLGTAKALHHRALGRLRREMAAWSGGEHE